ncbi:DUF4865 family protein [Pseudonocardiaceae bacterium YIM PH 21723]|nr:DUF4865 family protein [Pseudonocardiaceae bacterium YIM PH 21723]
MYAMQYEITLPADYDMQIIRKRVENGGHTLDDREGLACKAYLIREHGIDGSPVNQYAPFYLWRDTAAMADFLVRGGGFQHIIRDFGRPPAQHWTGIATLPGPSRDEMPRAASRTLDPIPVIPGTDQSGMALSGLIDRELAELQAIAGREGVHTAALAVDPQHWTLVRFILWTGPIQDQTATERYEVLHLSTPG